MKSTCNHSRGRTIAAGIALMGAVAILVGMRRHQSIDERGTATNVERNKATARRWSEELWSKGNLAVVDEIVAPTYVRHDAGDPFPARGPEDVRRIVTMLRAMLPDLTISVDAMVAEGDFVVSRYTATATDTRGYMGSPATGRTIRTAAMQMFRFENGKIVESWAVRDDLGTLRQLGHLPPVGAPVAQGRR